jgi:hypothetical protein
VIVNYIEDDFRRPFQLVPAPDVPIVSGSIAIPAGPGAGREDVATLTVTCERPPVSFENDTCRHGFNLSMPYALAHTPEKVRSIKQSIVRQYLRGQLWRSPHPYGLMKLLGRPVSLHHYRNPELFSRRAPSEEEAVEAALGSLREIRAVHRNVLVTLHPLFSEMFPQPVPYERTAALVARDPTLRVVVMRDRLTAARGDAEPYGWYNLPFDVHMSQRGGSVYARAMADLVVEHLASADEGSADRSGPVAPRPAAPEPSGSGARASQRERSWLYPRARAGSRMDAVLQRIPRRGSWQSPSRRSCSGARKWTTSPAPSPGRSRRSPRRGRISAS